MERLAEAWGGGRKVDFCDVPRKRVRVQTYAADRHTE